jgi:hypothetical protein
LLEVCCCAEEKTEALRREVEAENHLAVKCVAPAGVRFSAVA